MADLGTNGTSAVFIKWMLGLNAALLLAFGGWVINKLDRLDSRVAQNEIAVVKLEREQNQLDDLTKWLDGERKANDGRFRVLEKDATVMGEHRQDIVRRFEAINARVDTISQRILVVNSRLDEIVWRLGQVQDKK